MFEKLWNWVCCTFSIFFQQHGPHAFIEKCPGLKTFHQATAAHIGHPPYGNATTHCSGFVKKCWGSWWSAWLTLHWIYDVIIAYWPATLGSLQVAFGFLRNGTFQRLNVQSSEQKSRGTEPNLAIGVSQCFHSVGFAHIPLSLPTSFVHWSNNSLLQSRPWIHVAFAHSRLPSEVHPFQRWSSHSLRPILILRIYLSLTLSLSLSLSYVYYLLLHLLLPALESMHSINAWCKIPREHNVQRFLVGSWIFVPDYCWCYCHYPGGCSSNWHRSFRALQD